MSVAAFKAELGVDSLQVIKNPNTGKLFMAVAGNDGSVGSVSKKITSKADITRPVISEFPNESGVGTVFVLHNQSSSNEVATL